MSDTQALPSCRENPPQSPFGSKGGSAQLYQGRQAVDACWQPGVFDGILFIIVLGTTPVEDVAIVRVNSGSGIPDA